MQATPYQLKMLKRRIEQTIINLCKLNKEFDYLPDSAVSEDAYDYAWSLVCAAQDFDNRRHGRRVR